MRIPRSLLTAALCAASIFTAQAQTSALASNRAPASSPKIPGGMSFTYDAQHGQINASGVQLKPAVLGAPTIKPTTGTVTVTLNINVVTSFPKGAKFACSVMALGGVIDTDTGAIAGGIETVNGWATVTGHGAAACTLTIPYSWSLPTDSGADSGLILAFGASGVLMHSDDIHKDVLRSTLQLDGIENLPANGATSKYTFDVAL